jgi:hypothetical protein
MVDFGHVATRTVPPDDGFWLDNRDGVQHRRKQPIEPDEGQSVGNGQARLRGNFPAQDVQLMSENRDLGFESRLRLER